MTSPSRGLNDPYKQPCTLTRVPQWYASSYRFYLAFTDLCRMAAPDSPWISGGWRPDSSSEPKQGFWTPSQDNSGFRRTSESQHALKIHSHNLPCRVQWSNRQEQYYIPYLYLICMHPSSILILPLIISLHD